MIDVLTDAIATARAWKPVGDHMEKIKGMEKEIEQLQSAVVALPSLSEYAQSKPSPARERILADAKRVMDLSDACYEKTTEFRLLLNVNYWLLLRQIEMEGAACR